MVLNRRAAPSCGSWPLPAFSLIASVVSMYATCLVVASCIVFPPVLRFLAACLVRFVCLKSRVFAVCLRRPCRLASSADHLSASARFCAKQNILCFLRVGLLSGVCCCVLTAKILSFIFKKSRPLIFQFPRNRIFPGLLWAFLRGALWPLLLHQKTQDKVPDGVPNHIQRVNHAG